ncbi:MAG TPA: hypothetical protein VGV38_17625 [Pyrinomonadaceae bacterium]|nr:hypothetical protein [Pyrinomonadaceae bacterium]
MSKVEEIKSQLAQRLEKQAARPKAAAAGRQRGSRLVPAPSLVQRGAQGLADAQQSGVTKLSVSLYDFDISRIDEIKDFMRQHGVRNLSDSEALRLACRAVAVNDAFLEIYEGMLGEDRRRKKAS